MSKGICLPPSQCLWGELHLHCKLLALALILLLASINCAGAYGSSVEDLAGSFSIGKTIKIASGSECFSSSEESDPLTPPQSSSFSGSLADSQAPSLADFAISPQSINATSPQPVNLTAHIIDDQSVWAAEATFSGPEGQKAIALFTGENRTEGTAKDGIFETQLAIAFDDESGNVTGDWNLQNLTLVDSYGNREVLLQADLQDRGLPTTIKVV